MEEICGDITNYTTHGDIINYTTHNVTIENVTITRAKYIARCAYGQAYLQKADGTGDEIEFPAPHPGVVYVVPSTTALALIGRKDIFVPGAPIRDGTGRIIGCRGLHRI